jgi:AraC-like DNA-binding protein
MLFSHIFAKIFAMKQLFQIRILFLIVIPITLFGQVKQNDLTKLSYTEIVKHFFEHEKQLPKQIGYANLYIQKAKNENNLFEKARGYYMFSLLYKNKNDDLRIKYLDSVVESSKNLNDKYFPATIYSEKAYLLKDKYKYREAIDNFILAEQYAIKNNIDFYYNVRLSIAILKSENLGEVDEAMELYQECYKYYKTKDTRDPKYSPTYLEILFDIADAHKALYQADSATYYNKLGYKEAVVHKDEQMQYLFVLNEGANLVVKKNYKEALDSIQIALPKMIALNNIGNTLAGYYYLGKAYQGIGKKDIAAYNYKKVDSIYQKTKRITPEFVSGYPFLIAYYKSKGDKTNQLQYLTSYMDIDSTLQKNYKELTKKLEKEYDRPHFVKDKEALITALRGNQNNYLVGIVVLLLLVAGAVYYGVYQRNLKKIYHARFEKIIQNTTITTNDFNTKITQNITDNDDNKIKSIGIAEELINQLCNKLNDFETRKGYLQPDITLQLLADRLETNNKYLASIIKEYKNKSFIPYINDLRIDNAINELQQNKNLKKYTIEALAIEFGFNNAQSFASAFDKKTGLKPSFFIKELKKNNSYIP